jgi:nanoRNase/pAp phosphatase (c-di-AMP/oligoRNAs hydrolase)
MADKAFLSEDSRIDVSAIAAKFGGGGHRNAAGYSISERTMFELIS